VRKAMQFLYPYLADKTKWPRKPDVQAWEGWPARQPSLLFAGLAFGERNYLELWQRLPADPADSEVRRNIGITQPLLWLPASGGKHGSAQSSQDAAPLFVGLRRSSYGLPKQNRDDAWWISRAVRFATNFPHAQPLILEVISNYQDDGSTEIEFPRPAAYQGSVANMTFHRGNNVNHERALSAYDAHGVKAILQFEPGHADVATCFELAHQAFAHHSSVIGLAIDGEWFRTKVSRNRKGLAISDREARGWMEQVLRFNPSWVLVLKHFEPDHLPANYRHRNLWFVTDSQDFPTQAAWMADMRSWAAAFKGSPLGAQFGYKNDQQWWSGTPAPPVDLGRALLRDLPDYRMLLWVDFTAAHVEFGPK